MLPVLPGTGTISTALLRHRCMEQSEKYVYLQKRCGSAPSGPPCSAVSANHDNLVRPKSLLLPPPPVRCDLLVSFSSRNLLNFLFFLFLIEGVRKALHCQLGTHAPQFSPLHHLTLFSSFTLLSVIDKANCLSPLNCPLFPSALGLPRSSIKTLRFYSLKGSPVAAYCGGR